MRGPIGSCVRARRRPGSRRRRGFLRSGLIALLACAACTSGPDDTTRADASTSGPAPLWIGDECLPHAMFWLEASDHVGEETAVFGRVVGWSHPEPADARSTFLVLGSRMPYVERVTIEIPPITALRFARPPETMLAGKAVCVFGTIERRGGVAGITIEQPEQITPVTAEPALGASEQDLAGATAVVTRHGFDPVNAEDSYCFECTLHVIVGNAKGAARTSALHAFFFVGADLVGTEPGNLKYSIEVVHQDDDTTVLGFSLFRRNDPYCCPSGGAVYVRFRWTGRRLETLDRLPGPDSGFATNV